MQRRILRTIQRTIKNGAINEHRTLVNLYHFKPNVFTEAFVHPSATVVGEVFIASNAQVWHNTVIRGDMNRIAIDQESIIMENCSLSTVPSILNSGEVAELIIGQKVSILPNCTLVSCHIEEDCYIGAGSVICEGAKIDAGSFIGPNSVVPPNRYIPPGQLWAGSPVRYVKSIDKPDRVAYVDIRNDYLEKREMYINEIGEFNSAYLEAEKLNAAENKTSAFAPEHIEEHLSQHK